MFKVFIVEDDSTIASALETGLKQWGYEAGKATDFTNIMGEFAEFAPQLVLLDITLPFYNGYYWCTEIRKVSKLPIIFISSASDNMNIIMAMNMGADDFIPKPFDMTVLTAKVQAMLRRSYDFGGDSHLMEHRGLVLNLDNASCVYDGNDLELTRNEYRILQLLLEKHGTIVGRDEIMNYLWQGEAFVDENTLSVNMTRIRKKLESVGLNDFIVTKKGLGYIVE